MPVAFKSTHEESQIRAVGDLLSHLSLSKPPQPPQVELEPFEQINKFIEQIKSRQEGTGKDQKKLDKAVKNIELAEETLVRAEEKRDAVQRKNNHLRQKLDKFEEKRSQAIKYWQEYGLDVRQISKPDDDHEHYEFIYKKLKGEELAQPVSVGIKLQDKKLSIVSRTPEDVLSDQVVESLNTRLESSCRNPGDEHIDYKLAMVMIRAALIKHPDV